MRRVGPPPWVQNWVRTAAQVAAGACRRIAPNPESCRIPARTDSAKSKPYQTSTPRSEIGPTKPWLAPPSPNAPPPCGPAKGPRSGWARQLLKRWSQQLYVVRAGVGTRIPGPQLALEGLSGLVQEDQKGVAAEAVLPVGSCLLLFIGIRLHQNGVEVQGHPPWLNKRGPLISGDPLPLHTCPRRRSAEDGQLYVSLNHAAS